MGVTVADVGAAVQVAQGFIQVLSDLTGSSSAIFQVDNKTKMTLSFLTHAGLHGGIHETPPTQIAPGHAGIFSAQSTGIATGVEGSATYAASGFDVTLKWKMPFVGGTNEAKTDLNGELAARYSGSAIAGVGAQKAHMHFEVTANVLDFVTIAEKHAHILATGGFPLGNPLTMDTSNLDNVGRSQQFEHGVIYWSPTTAAHEVHGRILDKWTALEREAYGYPASDEMDVVGGKVSHFQHLFPGQVFRGSIYWSAATDAHEVRGAIREAWWQHGGPGGFLGFPTADEADLPGGAGRVSVFQHGSVSWNPLTGTIVIPSA